MISFTLNGEKIQVDQGDQDDESNPKRLIDFLRDDKGLTSVKDGCSKGACGTCTVIIDKKSKKSCVQKVSKLEGTTITTVEGLSNREKEVYDFAFAEAGAVQCGFCIPGMVLSAKVLIDNTPDPSKNEIVKALRNNICRCTGYVKIIEAVKIAARYLREHIEVPKKEFTGKIGEDFHRIDAREKTLGYGQYADDMRLPGMV